MIMCHVTKSSPQLPLTLTNCDYQNKQYAAPITSDNTQHQAKWQSFLINLACSEKLQSFLLLKIILRNLFRDFNVTTVYYIQHKNF